MTSPEPTSSESRRSAASVDDVVNGVVSYAKAQTIGPLRGAGRWLAWGAIGAVLIGVGGSLALLGLLRLVQTEWSFVAGNGEESRLSWLPYLIVFVVGATFVAIALGRINRSQLLQDSPKKEDQQ